MGHRELRIQTTSAALRYFKMSGFRLASFSKSAKRHSVASDNAFDCRSRAVACLAAGLVGRRAQGDAQAGEILIYWLGT
jgi:hypothetical protein